MRNKSRLKVNPTLANGLDGAGIGLVFGCLSLVYVGVVRMVAPEAQGQLRNMPMAWVAFLYLVAAPGLGFLGGIGRTWLRGRIGSTILAMALGAAAAAIVLPFLPKTKSPWGPVEYFTIVGMALLSGLLFGGRRA